MQYNTCARPGKTTLQGAIVSNVLDSSPGVCRSHIVRFVQDIACYSSLLLQVSEKESRSPVLSAFPRSFLYYTQILIYANR